MTQPTIEGNNKNTFQVIQFVTKLYPRLLEVTIHPLKGSQITIPKKVTAWITWLIGLYNRIKLQFGGHPFWQERGSPKKWHTGRGKIPALETIIYLGSMLNPEKGGW